MKSLSLKKITQALLIVGIFIGSYIKAEEINSFDIKSSTTNIVRYLTLNKLVDFDTNTKFDHLEVYENKKGYKFNIIVLKPLGYLILSNDYEYDPIVHFSDQKWDDTLKIKLIDKFKIKDDKPNIYRKKWNYFINIQSRNRFLRQLGRSVNTNSKLLTTVNWDQLRKFNNNSVAYNSQMPFVENIQTPNKKAYAGCVAVAMAITMNYHQYPVISPISNTNFNWSYKRFDTSLATLLHEINLEGNSNYTENGTGMSQENMLETLRFFGYITKSYRLHSADGMYSFVKKHIDKDRPSLLWTRKWTSDILGLLNSGWKKHGWNHTVVVDGYKKISGYIDNDYYLHINYGWGGFGNRWWKVDSLADFIWGDRLGTKSLDVAYPRPSIIDGAGSIINPNNDCWGCNKDEADMQSHPSNRSTVVFQWNKRETCPYLNIGLLDSKGGNNWILPYESFDVKVHQKKWDSTTSKTFNATLPITIKSMSNWNTIAITSQTPINSTKKIVAICSKNRQYPFNDTNAITNRKLNVKNDYFWAGNSSVIRRSNPNSNQSDGVYKDVAIALNENKAITLFQWQPSKSCSSLKIKAGFYPSGNGNTSSINSIEMKMWASKYWDNLNSKCNNKLPCTIKAPGIKSYYIIKIKTNATSIYKNYISAVCQ